MLVHNTLHDDYVGRLAICRIRAGSVKQQQQVSLITPKGVTTAVYGAFAEPDPSGP